jgi:hypothetical protein
MHLLYTVRAIHLIDNALCQRDGIIFFIWAKWSNSVARKIDCIDSKVLRKLRKQALPDRGCRTKTVHEDKGRFA